MVQINWGLLNPNAPGPGERFQQGFERGREQARQNALQEALRQLGSNPEDPQALGRLMQVDPATGMQYRTQQLQQRRLDQTAQREALEARREDITRGAQLLREINPQDQAGWDRFLAMAPRVGISLQDVPTTFDQSYRDGIISIANAFEPDRNRQTSLQQNYEWLLQNNPQAAAAYLRRQTEPLPRFVTRPDGSIVMLAPEAGAEDDEWDYSPPPQGGPTPPASGNFPAGQ